MSSSTCVDHSFLASVKSPRKGVLSFSTSIGALAAAMLPGAVHAQKSTDDETVTTEVVAISGQEVDGATLGSFLPVVIGGEGDLLFLSQTANNSFVTFDGNLEIVANARPFGLQNQLSGNYSIDSFGDRFALTTQTGIFTGSVSDNVATPIDLAPAVSGFSVRDTGNLDSAAPLILNNRTALLLSNVGVNEPDGSFIGNTANFAFLAEPGDAAFEVIPGFTDVNATSLNFAGPNGLLASTSGQLASPNSAITSNLFRINLAGGADGLPLQIGPNGSPQLINGSFFGGDLSFAGFSFNDNTGGNFIGSGANFGARAFSANSVNEAFVLGNALLALDGSPGSDVPGELLVFDEQVIAVGSNVRIGTQTSVGEVAFRDFDNVILAENGDLFFTADTSQVNGQPLANAVGLWRVVDPGGPNQAIVAVLQVGDGLVVTSSGLNDLFAGGSQTEASVASFDTNNISLSQGLTRDGRPQLISVNEQGHVATILRIQSSSGPVDAIVAQDENGVFHVVAFIGQTIDVDGQGDLRRITNFTAQFGSNDIDGAGDLYNLDEQLGFLVTLDRNATTTQEFDQAVFRVSLNGVVVGPITEFLWQGGCGDDEFSTSCVINGENGSNWVNAEDTDQIAQDPPGENPGLDAATIVGADVRIAVVDVDLARINSDSTITLENGRTLSLVQGGTIDTLVITEGTVTSGQTLNLGNLTVNGEASVGNVTTEFAVVNADLTVTQDIEVTSILDWTAGNIDGDGDILVSAPDAMDDRATVNISGRGRRLSTILTVDDGLVNFADGSNTVVESGSTFTLMNGSSASLRDGSITGTGDLVFENQSEFTANGQVRIAPSVTFRDATGSGGASRDVLNVTRFSELTLDDISFVRTTPGTPEASGFAQINIEDNGRLTVTEGHELDVSDFVRITGGTVQVDGTLSISEGSVLENLSAITTPSATIDGGGLLLNKGQLTLDDPNSDAAPILIDVLFANVDGGTFTLDRNATFLLDAGEAAQSPVNLFELGIQRLTGSDISIGNGLDVPDVAVLIESQASSEADQGPFNQREITFEGDGAVFLLGSTRIGQLSNVMIESGAVLNGEFNVDGNLTFDPDATDGRTVTIVDGSAEQDVRFLGPDRGSAVFNNVTIAGVSSNDFASGSVVDDMQSIASFFSDMGARANTGIIISNAFIAQERGFDELLAAIGLPGGQAPLRFNDVTGENLRITLDGITDFENLTLSGATGDDAPQTELINQRLTRLRGDTLIGENSIVRNEARARLDIDANGGVADISSLENEGTLVIAGSAAGNTVSIDNFTQRRATSEDGTSNSLNNFGVFVVEGATLTANKHNLITADDVLDGFGVGGNVFASGTVTLLDDMVATEISRISAGADIEIRGGGSINNLDVNGTNLTLIEGRFLGSGRFTGDSLTVSGEDAEAGFETGISTSILAVEEGAEFDGGSPTDGRKSFELDQLIANGFVRQEGFAASTITNLQIGETGSARFQGDLTVDTADIQRQLFITEVGAGAPGSPRPLFTARQINVGARGDVRVRDASIRVVNIAQNGAFNSENFEFLAASVAGRLEFDRFTTDLGALPTLDILSRGFVKVDEGLTLSTLMIAEEANLQVGGPLEVLSTTDTTIGGVIQANDSLSFAGGLTVTGRGVITSLQPDSNISVTATDIFVEGELNAAEISVTNGNLELLTQTPTIVGVGMGDINANRLIVSAGSGFIRSNGGIVINASGAMQGLVLSAGDNDVGYDGAIRSLIRINGTGQLFGDLLLAGAAEWRQTGNLTVDGFLRGIGNHVFAVDGAVTFNAPADSMMTMQAPSDASDGLLRSAAVQNVRETVEDDDGHLINGTLVVTGDATFEGDFDLASTGIVQIGGNAQFDQTTVDGALMVGGLLTADTLTITGEAQFGSGQFGDLTLASGARLIGGDFETTADFTNLGTFQLGNVDAGGGEFSFGGIFRQAGIFSGVGTIHGDLLQEAVEGGLAANELLFNPGFSPGIVDIIGDATFNDGMVLFEIGGLTPGTEHDQINVTGNLTIGSNAMIVVDLLELADGSGIFLPRTGDEVVLFTAANITPDDAEDINFAVIDVLPRGFTLVPDIARTETGEIFRVLRGFDGSLLSNLSGLDPSQAAVASAIDFLSSSESGVPSDQLFATAVDLQFADARSTQLDGLTALSNTTISAVQDSALRAGSIGLGFAQSRLRSHREELEQPEVLANRSVSHAGLAISDNSYSASELSRETVAAMVAGRASQSGGYELISGDGGALRIVGSTSYLFGDSDTRQGTIGFDYDGWSANAGLEFEGLEGGLLLGASLSLGNVDTELEDSRGSVESDSLAATLYGQYSTRVVSLGVGYSFADLGVESQRQVLGASALGESDGNVQNFFARIGTELLNNNNWTFGPEAQFVHTKLEVDGYTETGAADFNLTVTQIDRSASALTLSGQLERTFETGSMTGLFTLGAGYQFALSGDEFAVNNSAFSVAGNTIFANALRPLVNSGFDLNAGISLMSETGVSVGAEYTGLLGENGQNAHAVRANATIPF